MFDPQSVRRDFPILDSRVNGQPLVYFDNAATTQKPEAVIRAVADYYRQSNANVHRAAHALSSLATAAFEQARESVAAFIGAASPREIVWTRGATEAINLVAQSWGRACLGPDDLILVSTLEHHANIVPWQMLAADCGARIEPIPLCDDGTLDLEAYRILLQQQPKLVALTQASNALGTLNPVVQMTRDAQAAGARVLIDGAQSTPHLRIDVQALGCDFFVFSGHKLFAPTGIGVLWGRESLLASMPPWQGGGEMIERVSFSGTRYAGLPFRFEAGTPNIAGAIGLAAAIRYLEQFDRSELEAHELSLFRRALELCREIPGFRLIGEAAERVSLMSFQVEGLHQQDLGLLLDQRGIAVRAGHHCAMPLMERLGLPGTLRASFAFYNSLEEVEFFAHSLAQIVAEQHAAEAGPVSMQPPDVLEQLERCRGWQERYRQIMLLGKQLPALPDALRNDDNRLHGCETRVWFRAETGPDNRVRLHLDADSRVIRGLIALVLAAYDGKTAEQILDFDLEASFERLGLMRHLGPSRGNGLRAIVDAVREAARRQPPLT
ncbi:MAG: SufS family cysteine desulfurase [Oceanospirillaceae bacterium]|nr:SufS family cysteine desulfurase [Oceanospirillaceae bacterium]